MYVTRICQWKCNCQNPFHSESWISFRALFLHFSSILVILIRFIFLLLEGPEIGSNKLWAIQRRNNSVYFHVKCTIPFGCIGMCDCGLALIFCWIGEFWPMLTNDWTSFWFILRVHLFSAGTIAKSDTYIELSSWMSIFRWLQQQLVDIDENEDNDDDGVRFYWIYRNRLTPTHNFLYTTE